MNLKNALIVAGIGMLSAACSKSAPTVEDAQNIVIDGVKLSQGDYLEKYCRGLEDDPSCIKVRTAKLQSSTRGEMPKWR